MMTKFHFHTSYKHATSTMKLLAWTQSDYKFEWWSTGGKTWRAIRRRRVSWSLSDKQRQLTKYTPPQRLLPTTTGVIMTDTLSSHLLLHPSATHSAGHCHHSAAARCLGPPTQQPPSNCSPHSEDVTSRRRLRWPRGSPRETRQTLIIASTIMASTYKYCTIINNISYGNMIALFA